MAFRYVPANLLRGGTVGTAPDATYQAAWLVDGLPGTPYQVAGGSINTSVTFTSAELDLFALVNHTISVNATVAGGTIVAGALQEDGIRLNPFVLIAPVTTGSVTLALSGNTGAAIVGELYGGRSQTLESQTGIAADFRQGRELDAGEPQRWETTSIAPYDTGLSHPRRLVGEMVLNDASVAAVQAWYRATRQGTRPSLVIPDDTVNDAWLALFQYRVRHEEGVHIVTLEITELPRTRW